MKCKLCGDNFSGMISHSDGYRRKKFKSQYCKTCNDIKGNTHAATFIKQAKKIVAWQEELPAYLESLNKPFPCTKCGQDHMTRPGGPAVCKNCKDLIKEERNIQAKEQERLCKIARDKESLAAAKRAADQVEEKKLASEREAKLQPLLMQIKALIAVDPTWTFFIDKQDSSDHAYYKEHVKISADMQNIWCLTTDTRVVGWTVRPARRYVASDMLSIKEYLPVEAQELIKDKVFAAQNS